MRWPWSRNRGPENLLSIGDPALAAFFGVGVSNFSGAPVTEYSALGLSAVWRAVSLISSTIASLPMRTLREVEGVRTRVSSFLDNPAGPDAQTPYEWRETVITHIAVHGNAFLLHRYNQGGGLIGLSPVHPACVTVEFTPGRPHSKTFRVNMEDGTQRVLTSADLLHIPGLSLDGICGLSPIYVHRNGLGTALAGDRSAALMFAQGALMSGVVTPEEDLTAEEAQTIKDSLNRGATGWENSSTLAVINRKLKFTPWSMSMQDAQFIESRQFQIEEVARIYGVPPHLLMQTEKQTSWGTGVAEQNRGLARFSLQSYTSRIEQRLSTLLPAPRFVAFDYKGLEKPTPEQEIQLLIAEVNAGLMTPNEARHILQLDPIEGGDALRIPRQTLTTAPQELEAVPS